MLSDLLDIAVVQKIMTNLSKSKASSSDKSEERDKLMLFGITGELPVILIKLESAEDAAAAVHYIRATKALRCCGTETDTVFAYDSGGGNFGKIRTVLFNLLSSENCELMLGVKGGVFIINYKNCSAETQKNLENNFVFSYCPSCCRNNTIPNIDIAFICEKSCQKHFRNIVFSLSTNSSIDQNSPFVSLQRQEQ